MHALILFHIFLIILHANKLIVRNWKITMEYLDEIQYYSRCMEFHCISFVSNIIYEGNIHTFIKFHESIIIRNLQSSE